MSLTISAGRAGLAEVVGLAGLTLDVAGAARSAVAVADAMIDGLAGLGRVEPSRRALCWAVSAPQLRSAVDASNVAAVVTSPTALRAFAGSVEHDVLAVVISDDPEADFFVMHERLLFDTDFYRPATIWGIADDADVHPAATIDDEVRIGAGCRIGPGARIGRWCELGPRATVDANAVIGTDGFEVRGEVGRRRRVRHGGRVVIGADATVGAGSVIARGLFLRPTTIGPGAHLDAHVHVAHDCSIGAGAMLAAGTTLAGSVELGADAVLGLGTRVTGGVRVGGGARVHAGAVVVTDVPDGAIYAGFYAIEHDQWLRKLVDDRRRNKPSDTRRRQDGPSGTG